MACKIKATLKQRSKSIVPIRTFDVQASCDMFDKLHKQEQAQFRPESPPIEIDIRSLSDPDPIDPIDFSKFNISPPCQDPEYHPDLQAYIDRLLTPKKGYAIQYAQHILFNKPMPEYPFRPWVADVQAKVHKYGRVGTH
jgi:hypothetical protein